MESVETADLIELVLMQREALYSQMQFWLSATFAVILASFFAGSKLTGRYRLFVGLLYLLATAMTLAGWGEIGEEIMMMFDELERRGISIDPPWSAIVLRLSLIAIGATITLVFLFHDRHKDGAADN